MSNLFEIGLFTVAQTQRLTRIPRRDIRRWLYGYESTKAGIKIEHPSLWQDQISEHNLDVEGLGFLDLIDVQIVHAFRSEGVSMKAIRLALEVGRSILNVSRPFSHEKFLTDGRTILTKIVNEAGDEILFDLCKRQVTMEEIMMPFLRGIIVYTNELASVWHPIKSIAEVVVNPRRSFGRPIIERCGITTETLYNGYKVEGNARVVARAYNIDENDVLAAVRFEKELISEAA